jgi:hypothetical protein
MRWWSAAVVVLVGAARIGAQSAPRPGAYVVLGLDGVTLAARVHVSGGDVGANRGSIAVGARARIDGTIAGDTIRIGRGARASDLLCRFVIGPVRYTCSALSGAVVDLATLPLVQVAAGTADVRVPARARAAPLGPAAYGDARVGRAGELLLAGGTYAFRTITLGPGARLLCTAACRVEVQTAVVLAARARLGAAAPLDAHAVRVDIEAKDRTGGFSAASRTTVDASIYTPQGRVRLGERGRYTGGFLGRSVNVGARARVTAASVL